MHTHDLSPWQHAHDFIPAGAAQAERRTRWVVGLTCAAMVVELVAGWLTGSMALMADAWHMASHVGALGLTALAYAHARRQSGNTRYTFGTGKVGTLAGYTSALLLAVAALWMAWESFDRLLAPVPVHYAEAMAVAAFGLIVNLVSAHLLEHTEPATGAQHGHDHNLRAAYLHVLADALTSLLALAALAGGMAFGWAFLDPLIGLVGAAVILRWAWGLARDSAQVLLDAEDHGQTAAEIRRRIEALPDHRVADLHVWRVGPASRACIVSLVTHAPRPVEDYRRLLGALSDLHHLTIEVNHCRGERCQP